MIIFKQKKGIYNKNWKQVRASGRYIEDCIRFINENSIESIYIYDLAYSGDNIDFLAECPTLLEVNINSNKIKNVDGIYKLPWLKSLSVHDLDTVIDLSKLNQLEYLSADYRLIKNLPSLTELKDIDLFYLDANNLFKEFENLSNIKNAVFNVSKPTSLNGIENLRGIETLEITYFNRLEDISAIGALSESLRDLRIDNSKKIKDFTPIRELNNLETLALCDDKEIDSIAFIEDMDKLTSFIFMNTNVLDGDVSYCSKLEHAMFNNKKHYSHKYTDFKQQKE